MDYKDWNYLEFYVNIQSVPRSKHYISELLNFKLVVHTTGLWRVNTQYTQRPSPYCEVSTLRLGYKNQSFNAV